MLGVLANRTLQEYLGEDCHLNNIGYDQTAVIQSLDEKSKKRFPKDNIMILELAIFDRSICFFFSLKRN